MDDSHRDAFLADTDYDPEYVEAEQYLARALQVDLNDDEHFGDDWVLEPEDAQATEASPCATSSETLPTHR
jgi:hypothetical protein